MTKAIVSQTFDYTSEEFLNAAQAFADQWGLRLANRKFFAITNRPVIEREEKSGVRGRRPIYTSEEERVAARKESQRRSRERTAELIRKGKEAEARENAS